MHSSVCTAISCDSHPRYSYIPIKHQSQTDFGDKPAISPLSATHYCHHSSEVTPSLGPKVTVKEHQCTRVGRYPALHLAHLLAEQADRARRFQHGVLIVK